VTSQVEPRWVDDDRALAELVSILVDQPAYGLDTEFMSERSYWPQLCLVQVSWAEGVALVDPLACDVRALETVLRAPATMVTHAGASDLPILDRAIGARPSALFDVQLAAGFVGLGLPSLGTLVSALLGIRLDKSEQLADWSKRPLSDATRRYAAADVEHLFPLTTELGHRLEDMGRETWAASECEVLRTAPDRRVDPDVAWWKIKGASSMRGEKARVAQSVAAWRERRAQQLDVLPRFVLPDLALAAVVGRPPKTRDQLFALRGVNRLPDNVVRELLDVVEAGREMPKQQLRLPEKYDDGPELDAAVALLVAYVAELARAERIEKQLLATRDDVKALVYGRASRLDSGWRAQIAGDRLHRLLEGKAVIRLTDGGRHLQLED
jgi:ribonuclease D